MLSVEVYVAFSEFLFFLLQLTNCPSCTYLCTLSCFTTLSKNVIHVSGTKFFPVMCFKMKLGVRRGVRVQYAPAITFSYPITLRGNSDNRRNVCARNLIITIRRFGVCAFCYLGITCDASRKRQHITGGLSYTLS